MGYAISKPEAEPFTYDGLQTNDPTSPSGSHDQSTTADNDIFHLTKLRSEPCDSTRRAALAGRQLPLSPVRMLLGREAKGRFSTADRSYVLGRYLPTSGPSPIDRMDTRAYVSQFSADGSLFIAGFQGSRIRIYDVDHGWKVQKDVLARNLRWTITDTALSPDQRFLVYASMSPIVHIVNVGNTGTESYANVTDIHDGLDLSLPGFGAHAFGVFSVKFSVDGRELVAGSSDDSIYVYDLDADKLASRFKAHASDVNTVTFADESGNLIYSGSDDYLCKVWDRRCFNSNGQPAGTLTGHLEGITFIDSRGDGRYFISNGKDQTTKLWDIRKISSDVNSSRPRIPVWVGFRKSSRPRIPVWDYRWEEYPHQARHVKHPCDQSVATYSGHSVLRTLIRCYFSPVYSTGQRYIYTGSHDSCVYIYDVVTGEQVAKLDCHQLTVRDCSWHPYYPMLVSSSWDGLIAKWEFPGDGTVPDLSRNKGLEYMFRGLYL